jgi:hypothetical protein
MTYQVNRLAREVALVADNQLSDDPGLSAIVSLHGQMQWIPWTKPTPVNDLNQRATTGPQRGRVQCCR